MAEHRFPLGQVVITAHAKDELDQRDIAAALQRHAHGDWGELCEEDRRANDLAVAQDLRIFSAYDTPGGARFWIITEADRSATTILLPDDY